MQIHQETVRGVLKWFILASIVLALAQDITALLSKPPLQQIEKDAFDNATINNAPQTNSPSSEKHTTIQKQRKRTNSTQFEQTRVMLIQLDEGESYESTYNGIKQKMDFMHPQILVMSEKYPLPPVRAILSKVISFGQTGLLIIGVGGRFIPAINQHPLYIRLRQQSMLILVGGYFGLNMLQKMVSSSGAFQVLLEAAYESSAHLIRFQRPAMNRQV